ncbi:hypothetical protein PtA15_1A950 [Puccinia triticina]|uniref:Uncharacterized protein n=1 Tax=Puccinia triticina TaxID=208348 RepID=A0ABY7C8W5_9BASI|nr:uncharacterized protein PtA15_1A950 [Puccinia triticina]WAQ81608.1 hypothetical protein PtA15_1A950 [Puccinia triticina]
MTNTAIQPSCSEEQTPDIWPPIRLARLYPPPRQTTVVPDDTTTTQSDFPSRRSTTELTLPALEADGLADLSDDDKCCPEVPLELPRATQARQELERIQKLTLLKRRLAPPESDQSSKRRKISPQPPTNSSTPPPSHSDKPPEGTPPSKKSTPTPQPPANPPTSHSDQPAEEITTSKTRKLTTPPTTISPSPPSHYDKPPEEIPSSKKSTLTPQPPAEPPTPHSDQPVEERTTTKTRKLTTPPTTISPSPPSHYDKPPEEIPSSKKSTLTPQPPAEPPTSHSDQPVEERTTTKTRKLTTPPTTISPSPPSHYDKPLEETPNVKLPKQTPNQKLSEQTPNRPKQQERRFKITVPSKPTTKLPYLRRNWLTTNHHRQTQQLSKLCPYRIKIILKTHKICSHVNSSDINLLETELSSIQVRFQLFFLPRTSHDQVERYLHRQLRFWTPTNQHLREIFVTACAFPHPSKISLTEHSCPLVITVYHRPCLRLRAIALIDLSQSPGSLKKPHQDREKFNPTSEPIQRTALQRQRLNSLFGQVIKRDPALAKVEETIKSTARSKQRKVKVPPRIGALHFNTMEPYREGEQVYDSEDDIPDDQHHWRKFRSDQACERATQLSIVKEFNRSEANDGHKGIRTRAMNDEIRRLWNLHVRSISIHPSASGGLHLSTTDYERFIELYVLCFGHTESARAGLVRLLTNLEVNDKPHLRYPRWHTSHKLTAFCGLMSHYDNLDLS